MPQRKNSDSPPDTTPVESKRELRPEDVARRAHELYEIRGRREGGDLDDWLRAEKQLRQSTENDDSPPQRPSGDRE